MMLQIATIVWQILTTCQHLAACIHSKSHPSGKVIALLMSRETIIYSWHIHYINDTACQAAAMTKQVILLLNTDHTNNYNKPQLVTPHASILMLIWLLLASKVFKAGELQVHQPQFYLYSYWEANKIDTSASHHDVNVNPNIPLRLCSDASVIFARHDTECKKFN
jgi:hypothetical protein